MEASEHHGRCGGWREKVEVYGGRDDPDGLPARPGDAAMSTINRLFLDRSSGTQSRAIPLAQRRAASKISAQWACTAALLVSDAVAIAATLFCCATVQAATHGFQGGQQRGWWVAFSTAAAGLVIYLLARSHYTSRVPFWTELQDVIHATLGALVFSACLILLNPALDSGLAPAFGWLMLPILAVIARKISRSGLIAANLWQVRTVLVATADNATHSLAALRSEPALGYDIVALIDPAQWGDQTTGPTWGTLLEDFDARLLVIAYDASAAPGRRMIESLVRERVAFAVMPQLGGLPALGFDQTRFFSHDTVMVSYRNNLARPMTRLAKDRVRSGAGGSRSFNLGAVAVGCRRLGEAGWRPGVVRSHAHRGWRPGIPGAEVPLDGHQ